MRHRLVGALGAVALVLAVGCQPVDEPVDDAVPAVPEAPEAPDVPAEPAPEDPPPGLGVHAVSAGHPAAVEAGIAILDAGGNAVDAAVATAFAVSVVEPFASGIGGGGAALVAAPGDDPVSYDYREVVAADGTIPASNTGVPGFVAGMATLHDDLGDLDLAVVLEPAIRLARDGSEASLSLANQLRTGAARLPIGRLAHLYPDGQALDQGDRLVQDELGDTLERLVADGPDSFYTGGLAEALAAAVDGLDAASLEGYEVQQSAPAAGSFADLEVVAAAPPLPGAALIQMLQVAEAAGVEQHDPGSADFVHHLAMSWWLADHHIGTELGDPAFVDVPVDRLTDAEGNAALAAGIPADGLLDVEAVTATPGEVTGNTTHLTVVDDAGLMVSMTNTLTNFWGSGQYELGFFLNDQLGRFVIGANDRNEPAPGRRAVSWSTPVIVRDGDGRPVLGIGSPGGRRIPNVLAQVLVRWALHDQPLADAVEAPRFHLEGANLEFEELPTDEVADDLLGRGYAELSVPEPIYYFGSVQALEVDHDAGEVIGARDPRRDADWAVGGR